MQSETPEIFYHIALMGNWREVVPEQFGVIRAAGLTRATSAVLGAADDIRTVRAMAIEHGIDLNIAYTSPDFLQFEHPTLAALQQWSKENPDRVALYCHTKGVANGGKRGENPKAWRGQLMLHNVTRWRENFDRLKVSDAIGMSWNPTCRFFGSNFWMARTDWINQLPDVFEFARQQVETCKIDAYTEMIRKQHGWLDTPTVARRMSAESWVGSLAGCRAISVLTKDEHQRLYDQCK